MKISLEWLSDFITFTEKDPEAIARRVTAGVAEVDEIEQSGERLNRCVVGAVRNLRKHPNADKLSLSEVETDQGRKKIVCGGTNLSEGMRVAFAHVGAIVSTPEGPMTLKKATIRGEESEGMICSAEELGLEDRYPPLPSHGSRPVIDLADRNANVGEPLAAYLGMNDTVLSIDNHAITHRADLFSHIGFARECVALGVAQWKKDPVIKTPRFGKGNMPFKFIIDTPALMPRYCGCMVEIDNLGETPAWMRRRLKAMGSRSINLPIDITNYVAMEIGVPLHSFDADDIHGTVHMRAAKKGERIVTLDGKERDLPENAMILADDNGVFDLLGIMGGLRSSTKASTRRIYLHSASLDPVSIRRTVTATGHRTDAATVYEKGVPFITTEQGFYRALELIAKHVPGARIVSKRTEVGTNGGAPAIVITMEKIKRSLGIAIPEKRIVQIFTDLGFAVKQKSHRLEVAPPLWRLGDIHDAHDLVEEIGRIYGYNEIPPTMPGADVRIPARDARLHRMRDTLKDERFFELLPMSLTGSKFLARAGFDPAKAVRIANPIGEELGLLQTSTLPSLLEHAEKNLLYAGQLLKAFTIGKTFTRTEKEVLELGFLILDKEQPPLAKEPFLLGKFILGRLASATGLSIEIKAIEDPPPCAHPGRTAAIHSNGKRCGILFEVHPRVRERYGLPGKAAAALVDLTALLTEQEHVRAAKPIPAFPGITYDVTIALHRSKSAEHILRNLRRAHPLLESIEVADLFRTPKASPGECQWTLRCTYRAKERTLTADEVQKVHESIIHRIKNEKS